MLLFKCIYVLIYLTIYSVASDFGEIISFQPGELKSSEMEFLIHDPEVTHKVVFELSKKFDNEDGEERVVKVGDISLGLFGWVAPRTVKNFLHLASMRYGYGYIGSPFHRIIPDFMVQGGDFTKGDGTGGHSIFKEGSFDDENFDVHHNKIGRLSMANSGPNTNGGQFFITTKEFCQWLDGKHVVFGQLVDGLDTLQKLSYVETDKNNKPIDEIFISNIFLYQLPLDSTLDGYFRSNVDLSVIEIEELDYTGYYLFFLLCTLILAIGIFYSRRHYKRELLKNIQKNKSYY